MELLDSIIHGSMNIGFGIGLAIIIATVLLIVVFAIRGEKSNSSLCYLPALILTQRAAQRTQRPCGIY